MTTQFWPEIDTYIRLNENTRIYVPLSWTREGADDSDQDGTVGVFLDYFTLPIASFKHLISADEAQSRHLMLRLGYGYTAKGGGQPATNTLRASWTGRLPLPWQLLASDRNRFDLNFSGGEFDPVYRNRFRLDRSFAVGKSALNPYVYGEFFYSFDQGSWIKKRAVLGLEVHVWERFVPEVYFQRDYNSGSTGDVNGIGLTFSIYLR